MHQVGLAETDRPVEIERVEGHSPIGLGHTAGGSISELVGLTDNKIVEGQMRQQRRAKRHIPAGCGSRIHGLERVAGSGARCPRLGGYGVEARGRPIKTVIARCTVDCRPGRRCGGSIGRQGAGRLSRSRRAFGNQGDAANRRILLPPQGEKMVAELALDVIARE